MSAAVQQPAPRVPAHSNGEISYLMPIAPPAPELDKYGRRRLGKVAPPPAVAVRVFVRVKDISASGLGVQVLESDASQLPIGQEISIHFRIENKAFDLTATVIWCRHLVESGPLMAGLVIKRNDAPDDAFSQFSAWINRELFRHQNPAASHAYGKVIGWWDDKRCEQRVVVPDTLR